MASSGFTHLPPVELHPGALAIVTSMSKESAMCRAKRKASFHPSERYGSLTLAALGMLIPPASNWWKPPMPDLFIHSMSFLIPSFETLPSIQCHHTCGLASLGGSMKILASTDVSIVKLTVVTSLEGSFVIVPVLSSSVGTAIAESGSSRARAVSVLLMSMSFVFRFVVCCSNIVIAAGIFKSFFNSMAYSNGRQLS